MMQCNIASVNRSKSTAVGLPSSSAVQHAAELTAPRLSIWEEASTLTLPLRLNRRTEKISVLDGAPVKSMSTYLSVFARGMQEFGLV